MAFTFQAALAFLAGSSIEKPEARRVINID
jgi:hypothetical protein